MKDDKNILDVEHFCGRCKEQMKFSSTDELDSNEFGILSVLIYICDNCENRIDIIDTEKTYLNEVGNYVQSHIVN